MVVVLSTFLAEWVCDNSRKKRDRKPGDHELGSKADSGEVRTVRAEGLEGTSKTELQLCRRKNISVSSLPAGWHTHVGISHLGVAETG
jgi:hypothetical protein